MGNSPVKKLIERGGEIGEEDVEELWEAYDKNQDGTLSIQEQKKFVADYCKAADVARQKVSSIQDYWTEDNAKSLEDFKRMFVGLFMELSIDQVSLNADFRECFAEKELPHKHKRKKPSKPAYVSSYGCDCQKGLPCNMQHCVDDDERTPPILFADITRKTPQKHSKERKKSPITAEDSGCACLKGNPCDRSHISEEILFCPEDDEDKDAEEEDKVPMPASKGRKTPVTAEQADCPCTRGGTCDRQHEKLPEFPKKRQKMPKKKKAPQKAVKGDMKGRKKTPITAEQSGCACVKGGSCDRPHISKMDRGPFMPWDETVDVDKDPEGGKALAETIPVD